jgi:hypothetical protein
LIAQTLGIQHKNLLETIQKYHDEAVKKGFQFLGLKWRNPFKVVRVVVRMRLLHGLDEEWANYAMTLFGDAPEVRAAKRNLVTAFIKAKELLLEKPSAKDEALDKVVDDFLAIIREAFSFAGDQFMRIKEQSVSQQRKLLKAKLSDAETIYEVAWRH